MCGSQHHQTCVLTCPRSTPCGDIVWLSPAGGRGLHRCKELCWCSQPPPRWEQNHCCQFGKKLKSSRKNQNSTFKWILMISVLFYLLFFFYNPFKHISIFYKTSAFMLQYCMQLNEPFAQHPSNCKGYLSCKLWTCLFLHSLKSCCVSHFTYAATSSSHMLHESFLL